VNGEHKIRRSHRDRLALVYLRQSTIAQVREHTESTTRQYALADAAVALGWDRSNVLVLDGDLGRSGRSTIGRGDFAQVVSKVCQGEAGLVFVLEASRLARNSADFQRVLEFCQVTDTLVADADGIYDLRDFNDQMLMGFKGTMSAVELHILAQRMQESKKAAARRGDLRLPLPIGYTYDIDDQVVMDPDQEVQAAVAGLFRAFEATGSCNGVVKAFRDRRFPTHGQSWTGEVTWMRLRQSQARAVLRNPAYAGAYVSGRYKSERQIDTEGFIRTRSIEQPPERWEVVIQGHHPTYISWEAFLSNQRKLTSNCPRDGARPPREGNALLQGVVLCGHCGGGMGVYYSSSGAAHYRCRSRLDQTDTPGCRSVSAALVDPLVERRLLDIVTPEQVALAAAAAEELDQREARALRAFELRVERAHYEASRAERAFHLCEPENRLVARSLEQRWQAKLEAVAESEAALEAQKAQRPPLPDKAELEMLATDLRRLWDEPTTSPRDRKRVLRTLITDVMLKSDPTGDEVRVGIRWRSGAHEQHVATRTRVRTDQEAVELIRRRKREGLRDSDVAAELRSLGLRTAWGHEFGSADVRNVRSSIGLSAQPPLGPGELTVHQVAERLGVQPGTVYYWLKLGEVPYRKRPNGTICVRLTPEVEATLRARPSVSRHTNGTSEPKEVALPPARG
jgi:DNA invertase Pin-like site-specific DNA recombinase